MPPTRPTDVFDQLIAYSATPIILSHSGPRAVHDHPRNIDDARLLRLAASGGVIQINTLGAYLKPLPETPEREAALTELRHEFGPASRLNLQQGEVYFQRLRALNAAHPPAQADFEDVVLHLLHVLNLIGPRHVGVGADWDGGGGVTGLQDVAALPRLTERLLAEGYSETDLADIWGGNALRLLKAAEDHAATLRTASPSPPQLERLIPCIRRTRLGFEPSRPGSDGHVHPVARRSKVVAIKGCRDHLRPAHRSPAIIGF